MDRDTLWFIITTNLLLIVCLVWLDQRGLRRVAEVIAVLIALLLLGPWMAALWPKYARWVMGFFA